MPGEVSARELLMDAAEVLIAERGLTVSLREIAAHAGQRNNSAVIYHFGGLDGLIAATLHRRMVALEQRRQQLVAELDSRRDVAIEDIVAAIVAPAMDIPYQQGATHYARFVEQIRAHALISEAVPAAEKWPAVIALTRRLTSHMPELTRVAQARRIRLMATAMFALMADYERRGELASPRKRRQAGQELTTVLGAVLRAPLDASVLDRKTIA